MICSISRLLVPAWISGVLAADLAHSELVGWTVAVAVGGLVYFARSRNLRLAGGGCAIPERPERTSVSDR